MKSVVFGQHRHLVVFDPGEEVVAGLKAFGRDRSLVGASFQAIGAFERSTIAYFDLATKRYEEHPVEEQVEVASLIGNLAWFDDEVRCHAHVVLGRRDASALAGHLIAGYVRPTLEVMLVATEVRLERRLDPATGLPLFN